MRKFQFFKLASLPLLLAASGNGWAQTPPPTPSADTNTIDFAKKIIWLIDNPSDRKMMGEFGYQRVVNELSWEFESKKLVAFYKMILEIKE